MGSGQQHHIQPAKAPDEPVVVAAVEGLWMVALEYDPEAFQCPANHVSGSQDPAAGQATPRDLEETSSQQL